MKVSLACLFSLFIHTLFISLVVSAAEIGSVQVHDPFRSHISRKVWRHVKPRAVSSHSDSLLAGTSTSSTASSTTGNSASSRATTRFIASTLPTATATTFSSLSSPASSSADTSVVSSPPSTSTPQPSQTTNPASQDIETVHERRLTFIVGSATGAQNISAWLSTLGANGKWPDSEVDYTTGCDARRANWPAQTHWQRITTMSAAWNGGLAGAEQYTKSADLRASISLAMDFWFSNDFTDPSCLDSGGTATCPCGTPGFWNTNWFSNIILIPGFVGESCLLLNDTLSDSQLSNCSHITGRAFGTFGENINGVGMLTGANTLDVAKVGIDLGLLTVNASLISDAYARVHNELVIENAIKADGIRPDGSFGQHGGIIYNGNYGKDYANDVLGLEIEAGGTQFAAGNNSEDAFATLVDGDQWMIYRNILTNVLHWDYSVLGRFISFPVIDQQATGSININLTQVHELGQLWQSDVLLNVSNSLAANSTSANAGDLQGNRMFYDNDYMVHRGPGYVTTVRMFSNRTQNTECVNSQNLLGFHLSDGSVHTYIQGNEYEDIAVAWDWSMIPGTTTDYTTPLDCGHTQFTGIEAFVGGASDGQVGVAAMRYTNPYTKTLHWQKAWFFLEDDVQQVLISNISSTQNATVFSVLDQRLHSGAVLVDGLPTHTSNTSNAGSLWHGNVGYVFDQPEASVLSLQTGEQTGNWSAIGTSTQPPATVDLFLARIVHKSLETPLSYTALPAIDVATFARKISDLQVKTVLNDGNISAVFDQAHNTAMVVFWNESGGSVHFDSSSGRSAPFTISSNGNAAVIFKLDTGAVTVSDPSQTLSEVNVTLSLTTEKKPQVWCKGRTKTLTFTLPTGGLAGSSTSKNVAN